MLRSFYQTLDLPEKTGKDIVLPDYPEPDYPEQALYISEAGELFCYCGICSRDEKHVNFRNWPYYLNGKHTQNCKKEMIGLFRIKNGCILLTGFVDYKSYNKSNYKELKNHIIRFPQANTSYFGIEERIETDNLWDFKENEDLTRECFGLTYFELEYIVQIYAEKLGLCNQYSQYPRITRSMKNDNFCDITGQWIPSKFPYIAFTESGYVFSHVSLYGFYRHIGAMLSMGSNTLGSSLFEHKTFGNNILNRIKDFDNNFPFEIVVTREYVFPEPYVK